MRCIKAIGVPASKQADEFCDMLGHMMKEPSKAIRKVFFDMVLSLFVEDIWSQSALTSGLENLLENVCPKLECEVPGLSGISGRSYTQLLLLSSAAQLRSSVL